MGITYLWAIILGVGMLFFPESPRYDYRHNKVDKAIDTLSKVYGIPRNHRALHQEFEEIKQKYEEEVRSGQISWMQLFRAPRMSYRVAVGVALQALQQLTGANYFFYYGTTVFKGAGIPNSYVTQMILGAVNFGTTFLGLYLIEHYGRRRSLIAGALWMFVCFMVFASVGHFSLNIQHPERTHEAGVVMVVFACLFILGKPQVSFMNLYLSADMSHPQDSHQPGALWYGPSSRESPNPKSIKTTKYAYSQEH